MNGRALQVGGFRADHRTVEVRKEFIGGRRTHALGALALMLFALVAVGVATGAMRSEKINDRLCETTGGGRFVKIPGFPGERVDRRLLRDINWMERRFSIFITDGHSTDPVHSANGEHPLGLALDIVPNKAKGGTWRDITRLAEWAEPSQNQPRAPFRWVGYDGDAGHGKRNHLHLSWNHSPAKFNEPARTVWTVKCPERSTSGDGGGGGSDGPTSGGIGTFRLAPTQGETGGVSLP